jgi:hypothetical protein
MVAVDVNKKGQRRCQQEDAWKALAAHNQEAHFF